MKKILKISLICIVILIILQPVQANASSGKLRSASICTDASGAVYGQHSSDNHWHHAVEHDSGWYPSGAAIYSNPCVSQEEPASVYVENEAAEVEQAKEEVKEQNTKPEITMKNKITISSKDLEKDIKKNDIINYLEIIVTDEEDGEISNSKVNITPSSIKKDDYGEYSIKVSYTDEGGLTATKKGTINIEEYENQLPSITYNADDVDNGVLQIYDYNIPESLDALGNMLDIEIIDVEDGIIEVTKDMIKVDENKQIITISVKDSDGGKSSIDIEYEIIQSAGPMFFLLFVVIIAAIVFIVIKLKKNKKSKIEDNNKQ